MDFHLVARLSSFSISRLLLLPPRDAHPEIKVKGEEGRE
jgi:hypothetical protein